MVAISQTTWGYIVSIAGFFCYCGLLAPISAYSRLFTGIQNDLNTTSVQTGWIGSMAWCGSYLGSPIGVVLIKYLGYRPTAVIGSVTASASYAAASFMNSYIGLVVLYGASLGVSCSLVIHTTYSTIFRTLKPPSHNKGISLSSTGGSLGAIFVIAAYEKMVPTIGWRATLQITGIYCAIFTIPAAFLISPHDKKSPFKRTKSNLEKEVRDNGHRNEAEVFDKSVYSISEGVEGPTSIEKRPSFDIDEPKHKSWLRLLGLWRTWLLFFGILFPAMSWSVYWVNIISFYESISIPADDIFIYLTIQSFSDLAGKTYMILFSSRLPRAPTLAILLNLALVVITALLTVVPTKPFLIINSLFVGVGRGWFCVLPLNSSVELLNVINSDQAVSVALIALGVGFLVGTIPTGLIYDATGSYNYAFILNALFYLIGGAIFIVLQVLKKVKRKRKLSRMSLTGIDNITEGAQEDGT